MGDSGAAHSGSRTAADGRGRPVVHSDKSVLNGILWMPRTGAAWADLPNRFPSGCTCFRCFTRWVKVGVMRQILEALARHLEQAGKIDLSECFIDGTFVVAKKGIQSGKDHDPTSINSTVQEQVTTYMWLLGVLLKRSRLSADTSQLRPRGFA